VGLIKRLLLVIVSFVFIAQAFAYTAFKIEHIEVKGLQHISESTVLNYLPVHVGETLTSAKSQAVIIALYKTELFNNVVLERDGNTLVITVTEQPSIGLIKFVGNKEIGKSKLEDVLKKAHIQEGEIYNSSKLKAITEGLKQAYLELGYYNVAIRTEVKSMPSNRIAIYVYVDENKIAKIREIRITGNHAFSESRLRHQLEMTTPGLITWITHSDRYGEERLDKDIQTLTTFYQNKGYIRFKVLSRHVSLSPDKSSVYIVIHISEGEQYHFSGFRLIEYPVKEKSDLEALIPIKAGDIFSRQAIINSSNAIGQYLADKGYAFPDVQALPEVNDSNHTVELLYHIKEGRRVYVRRVSISGNSRTKSIVARREMRQLEGSLYSLHNIDESKRRLANLPYFKNIDVKTEPVPGTSDQVDLNYSLEEEFAGRATFNVGYSDVEKFLYGASVMEPNLLGTGNFASLGFVHSAYSTRYNFSYNNPYYTDDGISRGFDFYYEKVTPGDVNITSYTIDGLGGSMTYGIPVSEFSRLSLGVGYDYYKIETNSETSVEVNDFLNRYGDHFNEPKLTGGWLRTTYDRAVFPRQGSQQSLDLEVGLPLASTSLGYYKASADSNWYFPLEHTEEWVLNLHGIGGYGNGYGKIHELPFFKNFFAGGLQTVPGYEGNSLGPKDSFGNALGGNVQLVGQANLIFPNFISDRLRTALVFAGGNVFQNQVDLNQLRYAAGLAIAWNSPIGLFEVGFAEALNKKPGDATKFFGFSFGTSI